MHVGISSLLYFLQKVGEKIAFSLSTQFDDAGNCALGKLLEPLANDRRNYSILRRSKGKWISLVMSSKDWDYCLAGDEWNADCKNCEVDIWGWTVGDDAWNNFGKGSE